MDILNYPACKDEIIKYMDYLPEDEQLRKSFLEAFVGKVTTA